MRFFQFLHHFLYKSSIILCILLLCLPYNSYSARNKKYAALIVDSKTGNILHQEYSNSYRYPASLTKMMTLYLAFEAIEKKRFSMNTKLKVSKHAARQPSMKLGLRRGQSIKVEDAVLSLIVKSANDVAVVLGEAIAGSEKQFALLMTRKARVLGMKHTTFQNATGLHHRRQKTTARDMAKLVIALQRDYPQYYKLFSRTSFRYKGRVYVGHNKVTKYYKGADGVKTGYINKSGYNLATSAKRDGNRLVGIVMGGRSSNSRNKRMIALLDSAFAKYRRAKKNIVVPVAKPGTRDFAVATVARALRTRQERNLSTPAVNPVTPNSSKVQNRKPSRQLKKIIPKVKTFAVKPVKKPVDRSSAKNSFNKYLLKYSSV